MSLIDDIEQSIIQHFSSAGLSEDMVRDVAHAVIEDIEKTAGGSDLYLPQTSKLTRKKRNESILADWKTGITIADIMRKYSVSKSTVYSLIGKKQSNDEFSTPDWRL